MKKKWIDVTAPGKRIERGHLHPLTLVQKKATDIFTSMGFEIAEGPEMETEYYNFDALNIPKEHPARDLMDTFWTRDKRLMRAHTSPVQIRYMETHQPPFRIIVPGRVFRYEATDATHEIQFYQLEGLMVGKNITLVNLKAVMEVFFREFFGNKDIKIRLRPSYFPFVEPGVEVDMKIKQKAKIKDQKWMEIAGAGMVHPKVLENVKVDPREWQGFAFGMGIDRLAMIKYKIDDVRLFYSGDLRFIKQF
ncbi:MAG: phenylalanine--tRNA ligase subunit alpha [Patescibacteria group bacterium]